MKNKVLLVNPPYIKNVYPALKKAAMVQIPLGLAYLAASLEKVNVLVKVLDANILFLSEQETIKKILKSDADIVGFTATTATTIFVPSLSITADPSRRSAPSRYIRRCIVTPCTRHLCMA